MEAGDGGSHLEVGGNGWLSPMGIWTQVTRPVGAGRKLCTKELTDLSSALACQIAPDRVAPPTIAPPGHSR